MTQREAIQESRRKQLVPDDKFDRHMTAARVNDIEARKAIFCRHVDNGIATEERRAGIVPSCY